MPPPKRTRRESAALRSGSFQPNSMLLRLITQPATSGRSWPGFAIGLVAVGVGPPRPGNPPRPAPGVTMGGASPRTDVTAWRTFAAFASHAATVFAFAKGSAGFVVAGFSPLRARQSSKLHGNKN